MLFRKTFLEHYHTSYRKSDFETFENAYHIYLALDSLIFYQKIGNREAEIHLIRYLNGIYQEGWEVWQQGRNNQSEGKAYD